MLLVIWYFKVICVDVDEANGVINWLPLGITDDLLSSREIL